MVKQSYNNHPDLFHGASIQLPHGADAKAEDLAALPGVLVSYFTRIVLRLRY